MQRSQAAARDAACPNTGLPEERARDGNPLLLSAAELEAALAHDGAVAIAHARDGCVQLRLLGGCLHLLSRCAHPVAELHQQNQQGRLAADFQCSRTTAMLPDENEVLHWPHIVRTTDRGWLVEQNAVQLVRQQIMCLTGRHPTCHMRYFGRWCR